MVPADETARRNVSGNQGVRGYHAVLCYFHGPDQNRIRVDDHASLQGGTAGHGPATCKHYTTSNLTVFGDARFFCDSDAKTIMKKFYSSMDVCLRRNYGAEHQTNHSICKFG
jgi:hypothetical protein